MKIKENMMPPLLINADITVKEAVMEMYKWGSKCLVVVNGDWYPLGIFGYEQLMTYVEGSCPPDEPVKKMIQDFYPVRPDDKLSQINSGSTRYLLVMEDGNRIVGVVPLNQSIVTLESYVNRLKTMLDAAYNGIIEVDAQGRIVTVNRAMEKIKNALGGSKP